MNESNKQKICNYKKKVSMVMNKVVKMRCKAVTENLFIVVGPLVEPSSTVIAKPKGSI